MRLKNDKTNSIEIYNDNKEKTKEVINKMVELFDEIYK